MAKIAKKSAIIFVLVFFLGFTALTAVMYLANPSQEDLQAEAECV
jgi:CHASE3 domain sensor protein